jgi:integrase/recombinase XerD
MRTVGRATVWGPLGVCADAFRSELARLGYTSGSAENQMWWVGQLSRWMADEGVELGVLNELSISRFLAHRRDSGGNRVTTPQRFALLLSWLRSEGTVPQPKAGPISAVEELLASYADWLVRVRGLSDRTIASYLYIARRFLGRRAPTWTADGLDGLNGAAVSEFVLQERARGVAASSLKTQAGALRTLLRYLYVAGRVPMDIAPLAPAVGGWRDTKIPPTISASDARTLLQSCDRSTALGLRDFAILSLLARLGLRASEVAGLLLDDIDWRDGEVVVHGKGRRADHLPLPTDVGEAVAAYLSKARPPAACRNVFVTQRAPTRPMHPNTVSRVVLFACHRAGLAPVRAHRLRHALATELVRQGVTLTAIGQLLRHRDAGTTATYAKVALGSLREVAQPWPGDLR